jgi:hypothetical protein
MILQSPFYQTQKGEIYCSSNYMQHEHAIANLFTNFLTNLGYKQTSNNNRAWQREHKKVIVCLADDFGVCRDQFDRPPAMWFDENTTVFTDNYMPLTTQYQVCQLPTSYFGIFYYTPALQEFNPTARFHFSVNRLDHQRLTIVLEFLKQAGPLENILANDYMNFNAWDSNGLNQTKQDLMRNVDRHWQQLPHLHEGYQTCLDQLLPLVPVRNHNLSVEQAHVMSLLNLVIETYAGDASIAFSEKIFRALVTPTPWIVFSAQNAVAYLKTLGFDVMDDMVDHSYDSYAHDKNKIKLYIQSGLQVLQHLKNTELEVVKSRCYRAARHNQQLLAQMQQNWPKDFALWLPGAIKKIQ